MQLKLHHAHQHHVQPVASVIKQQQQLRKGGVAQLKVLLFSLQGGSMGEGGVGESCCCGCAVATGPLLKQHTSHAPP